MTRKLIALFAVLAMLLVSLTPVLAEEVKEGTPVYGGTITISDYFDPPPAINGNVLTPSGTPGSLEYQYDRLSTTPTSWRRNPIRTRRTAPS